ncbi:DUF5017 domain-containing protein [Pedobacter nanyangensis]|uniref:DUF5017 domain-containing protein n=1 Tax=Pedobacter nanyangensis TaxID=1562389 RepID=UPI000DE253BF|nr:DUF5017 domain-containing protein [Pedobacter nanyangensis]
MKKLLFLLFIASLNVACKKLEDVSEPAFSVTTSKTSYKINENVDFTFSGNADIVTFYSGEIGNDYDHVNGRIMPSNFLANFESQTLDGTQLNQVGVYILKNYKSTNSLAGVYAADTIDISSNFRFAKPSDNRVFVNSGFGDISKYLDLSKPSTINIAIKQIVRNQNVYGTGNINRVKAFKLLASNDVRETTLFQHTSASQWELFSTPNKMPGRALVEATQLTLRNGFGAAYVTEYTEDWAVSQAINISPSTDMGPDLAVGVKSVADKMPRLYQKAYAKAGKYMVTFKAINQSVKGKATIIKQIPINIEN